jgi:transposase
LLIAAKLIGETSGASRFRTDARFARLAGVAPIDASSGNSDATGSIAGSSPRCTRSRSFNRAPKRRLARVVFRLLRGGRGNPPRPHRTAGRGDWAG